MKKILIVAPHFAPYRDDIFLKLLETEKYKIKFLITKGNSNHTEWNYKGRGFDYIQSSSGKDYGSLGYLYDAYKELLVSFNPDIVLTCGELINIIYLKIHYKNKKIIYISDQMKVGRSQRNILRKMLLKSVYRLADGFYVPGIAGKKYFEKFVDTSRIRMGCYTNDVERILEASKRFNRKRERKKLGIAEDDYVFLFVGKLIPNREIDKILSIAKEFGKKSGNVKFLIIGDGPETFRVKNYMSEGKVNVVYIPKVSLDELEKVYVVSDAYLYLGWEPYSLALYEAAILGLPVIANAEIGAVYDCVKDDINGKAIDKFDLDRVLNACRRAVYGEFNQGAERMKRFIYEERGTKWAAEQLMELLKNESIAD